MASHNLQAMQRSSPEGYLIMGKKIDSFYARISTTGQNQSKREIFLWLFSSGVATANLLPPSNPVFCILFCHTNYIHVFFHIYKPPLWSSSRPPAWLFDKQHPSTSIITVSPLDMSKSSQSGLSDFISKASNICCPVYVLKPYPIQPGRSQREP